MPEWFKEKHLLYVLLEEKGWHETMGVPYSKYYQRRQRPLEPFLKPYRSRPGVCDWRPFWLLIIPHVIAEGIKHPIPLTNILLKSARNAWISPSLLGFAAVIWGFKTPLNFLTLRIQESEISGFVRNQLSEPDQDMYILSSSTVFFAWTWLLGS